MNAILNAILNGAILSLPLTATVWLALRLLPRRAANASARYVIWWATLLAIVALPIAYLPASSKPSPEPAPRAELKPMAHVSVPLMPAAPAPANRLTVSEPARRFPVRVSTGPHVYVLTQGLLLAWAVSALLMLARLILSCAALLRRKRIAHSVEPPISLARNARLLLSNEVSAPMAVGFLRPAILIPQRIYTELNPEQIQQIAIHESAHLARHDDYGLLLERALEAAFALHPAVRFIARQIDLEREIACDAQVVGVTHPAASYAACLTRVAEISGPIPVAAAAFLQNRSQLSQRVDVLLEQAQGTRTRLLKTRLALAASTFAAMAFMLAKSPALLALSAPPPQVHAALARIPGATQPARPAASVHIHTSLVHPTHELFQVRLTPTPTPPTGDESTPIVVVPLQVTTPDGTFVTGLTREDFIVYEDEIVQPVTYLAVDGTPTVFGVVAMDWNAVESQTRDALDALDKTPGSRVEYIQPPDPFTWQSAAEKGLARLREFPNPHKTLLLLGAPDDTQGLPDPRDVTIVRTGDGLSILPGRTPRISYILGYASKGSRPDGKYVAIKAVVDRPGLKVRVRMGYLAGAPGRCSDWVRQAFSLPTAAACY